MLVEFLLYLRKLWNRKLWIIDYLSKLNFINIYIRFYFLIFLSKKENRWQSDKNYPHFLSYFYYIDLAYYPKNKKKL